MCVHASLHGVVMHDATFVTVRPSIGCVYSHLLHFNDQAMRALLACVHSQAMLPPHLHRVTSHHHNSTTITVVFDCDSAFNA